MSPADGDNGPSDLTPEDIAFIKDLRRARENGVISRRDALKAAGVLGVGAATGGAAQHALFGSAEAADTASGSVGAANNAVDVHLDELRDPGGDVVADVDDTGAVDWQGRGFTNLGSADTESLNDTVTLLNPSASEIQTAVNNAAQFDTIKIYGDWTADSTVDISTRGLTTEHVHGELSGGGVDVFDVTATECTIILNRCTGSGYNSGETLVYANGSKEGKIICNRNVESWQRLFYAHGNANGAANDWDIHLPNAGRKFTKALEFHSDTAAAEGYRIFGGTLFETTKTMHFHGTAAALGTARIFGTTFHGSAAARNTHEIHEEGNTSKNEYHPAYIAWSGRYHTGQSGSQQVVLADDTRIYYQGSVNNMGAVRVAQEGGDQTVSSGSWENLIFDTVNHDERGEADTTNNEFDVAEDGTYRIRGHFRPRTGTSWQVRVTVNGSNVHYEERTINANESMSIHYDTPLDAGDTVAIQVQQSSGSSIDLIDAEPNHYLSLIQLPNYSN